MAEQPPMDKVLQALVNLDAAFAAGMAQVRAEVAALQPPVQTLAAWLYPVKGRPPNNRHPFNERRDYGLHEGIDLYAQAGDEIIAVADGVIISETLLGRGKVGLPWKWQGGKSGPNAYGNWLGIKHSGDDYTTFYAHLLGFGSGIKAGVRVLAGTVLGLAGSTGNSTAPHLHFMAQHPTLGKTGYVFPRVVDPWPLLTGNLTNQGAIQRLYSVAAVLKLEGWPFIERLGWADLAIPDSNRDLPFDVRRLDTKPEAAKPDEWALVLQALKGPG